MHRLKAGDLVWFLDGFANTSQGTFVRRRGRNAVVRYRVSFFPFYYRTIRINRHEVSLCREDADNLGRLARHWVGNPEALPQDRGIADAD